MCVLPGRDYATAASVMRVFPPSVENRSITTL